VKAMFDRAAYGCKLFCCWCAQDIEANHFWESIGFIPLAFRAGSEKKGRVHIFWQRRIREGDVTTPYWFPSKTDGGMMRGERIILPIPPGTDWSDAKPIILPGGARASSVQKQITQHGRAERAASNVIVPSRPQKQIGWGFAPAKPVKVEKAKREKKPRVKNDPVHVAAARELRDRYLEQFNSGLVLSGGKYEVCRALVSNVEAQIEAKSDQVKMIAA